MNAHIGLSGQYRIEVRDQYGNIKQETDWFDNLILDIGLDRVGVNAALGQYARVGTGTSTPIVAQTQLDAQIAASSTVAVNTGTFVNSGSPLYETETSTPYSFAQGAVVGNITEIGVGWATTGATLFSRALIVDTGGSPIAITLTSIDQLTVYYKLKIVPSLADVSSSVTISGTPVPYTGRVSSVQTFGANSNLMYSGGIPYQSINGATGAVYQFPTTLGGVTSSPSAGSNVALGVGAASVSHSAYSSGTYYLDSTLNFPTGSSANFGAGIGGLRLYYQGQMFFQYAFGSAIMKTNTRVLTLTFRFSWSRA